MYNPMPTMPLAYNLTLSKTGRCLHNCSDNGRCEGALRCHVGERGGGTAAACAPSFNLLPPPCYLLQLQL